MKGQLPSWALRRPGGYTHPWTRCPPLEGEPGNSQGQMKAKVFLFSLLLAWSVGMLQTRGTLRVLWPTCVEGRNFSRGVGQKGCVMSPHISAMSSSRQCVALPPCLCDVTASVTSSRRLWVRDYVAQAQPVREYAGVWGRRRGWWVGAQAKVPTLVYVRGRSSDSALAASRDVGVSLHLVSRQVSQGHPSVLGAWSRLSHWLRLWHCWQGVAGTPGSSS